MRTKFSKTLCYLFVFLFMFTIPSINVFADDSFVVDDGVLLAYKGTAANVTIPSGVYRIADSAFSGNKNIKSVNLNKVSVIGNEAFRGCTSLSAVTGYDNVTSCGASAFFATPFLTNNTNTDLVMGSVLVSSSAKGSYIVPANVKSIAPYAFSNNTGITSLSLGNNVVSLGEGAFWKCTSLKSVSAGTQLSYIGAYAFEGTPFLTSSTKEFLTLGNGVLIDYNGTASSVVIPDTVKQIAPGTFYNNTKITSVTIPKSVSGIGMRAFAGCTSLKTVVLPDTITLLDKEAFANCTAITNITVPASVEVMGESVFFGCKNLKTAKLLTSCPISRGLFADCKNLTSVAVSAKITGVGELSFYNCSKLTEISLPETAKSIHTDAFKGASKVTVYCDSTSYAYKQLSKSGIKVSQIGDSNMDNTLSIKDATHIQKATADIVKLDFSSSLRADVDFNGEVNVRDATWIQKKIAGII